MKRVLTSALTLSQRTIPPAGNMINPLRFHSRPSAEVERHEDYLRRVGDKVRRLTETNLMPEALSLVDRLMISGYDNEAEETLNCMRDEGMPEVVSCIEKIKNLCKQSMFEEAKLVLPEMNKYGPGCNEHAHLVLIEGLINGGELEDAITVFKEMNRDGVIASGSAYDFMILAMCKENSLDTVVDLSSEMLEGGHIPRISTIANMFYNLCGDQRLSEARALLTKMKAKGAVYFNEEHLKKEFLVEDATTHLVMETIFNA